MKRLKLNSKIPYETLIIKNMVKNILSIKPEYKNLQYEKEYDLKHFINNNFKGIFTLKNIDIGYFFNMILKK